MSNKDDLLRMLDLKGAEKHSTSSKQPNFTTISKKDIPEGAVFTHSTSLKLDTWDIKKGHDLSLAFPEVGLTEETWADFHGMAFLSDPQIHEAVMDKRRHEFIRQMNQTPEYHKLHATTLWNEAASEVAAKHFCEEFNKLLHKDKERERKISIRMLKGKIVNPLIEEGKAEIDCIIAVAQAMEAAGKEVDEVIECCRAIGVDPGSSAKTDQDKIINLYKRIRNSTALKKICDNAGRYRLMAQSQQKKKVVHGYDDMVGVAMGGDVGRLLPIEMSKLASPTFQLDSMRRLVEKQSMIREYRGVDPIGKGPIVVCIDESGSMAQPSNNPNIYQAKAFALSMAYIAQQQKRWCMLVSFASMNAGAHVTVLKPGKWNHDELFTWLEHFFRGGTSLDVPINRLPFFYWNGVPKGKTDMIILTDGMVDVDPIQRIKFLEWKKNEKVRCISLVLNGAVGELQSISDEVHQISGISTSEYGIQQCLGV